MDEFSKLKAKLNGLKNQLRNDYKNELKAELKNVNNPSVLSNAKTRSMERIEFLTKNHFNQSAQSVYI